MDIEKAAGALLLVIILVIAWSAVELVGGQGAQWPREDVRTWDAPGD